MSEAQQVAENSTAPRRGGWFAMAIVGSVIVLIALAQLLGAVALAIGVAVGPGDGFATSPAARLSSPAYAVTSPRMPVPLWGDRDAFPEIGVAVTVGREGEDAVFIGVGSAADVAAYLEDVEFAELSGLQWVPPVAQTRLVPGSAQPLPPADQTFWVAAASGDGVQTLTWTIEPGDWTLVIMNADGSAGIDTSVRAGVEAPWAAPVAALLIAVSISTLLIGIALIIVGVFGWGRDRGPAIASIAGPYPVAVTGALDPGLSRGLWLVKWVLAIPHWIVLGVLWVAFIVVTIAAGSAILFTGRYPRSLFDFTVGVLRWNWRVSFYAYSALGTDRYPPFTLERADYPADLEIAYPERLSHGLVLVKSWLLALPHLLLVGVVTGSAAWGMGTGWGWGTGWGTAWGINWADGWGVDDARTAGTGLSLLGLLVVVAAVILLFSGRYQQPLFDLILGINRWGFRVAAYVALMRDEYPPFRLDQGSTEPMVTEPAPSPDGAEI